MRIIRSKEQEGKEREKEKLQPVFQAEKVPGDNKDDESENMMMTMIRYLFKLANIWRVSRRARAQVMTTSTVQRALVPRTRGRRQRRRMSSSMKEEKIEVITSFASGKPLEQSQSRFKSLEIDVFCEF